MVKVTKNQNFSTSDNINILKQSKAFGLIPNLGIFEQFLTELADKVSHRGQGQPWFGWPLVIYGHFPL